MSLGKLICGTETAKCGANATLNHLSGSIDRFAVRAVRYIGEDFSEEAESFGAFCARVTLENGCAALLGRVDTFRMLYLREFQAQGGYEHGKPAKSGFRWAGDVLSEDRPSGDLWNANHELAKISRALFSPHIDHIFWKPAAEAALDYASSRSLKGIDEIKSIDPNNYISAVKGKCSSLYSTLSKGVHWDSFVPSVVLDEGTLKDAIRDSLLQIGGLALVSHFIPTAFRSLRPDEAVATYQEFRESFK